MAVGLLGLILGGTVPAAAAPPGAVGSQGHYVVELGTSLYTPADVERELDLVRDANGELIRFGVPWAWIEPSGDVACCGDAGYDPGHLGSLDFAVNEADSRGLKVLLNVLGSPCWASSAPKNPLTGQCLPSNYWRFGPNAVEFGEFVRFLTRRYGDKLAGIEIWNEPNWGAGSICVVACDLPGFDATKQSYYANMVKQAYLQRENGVRIYAGNLHPGKPEYPQTLWTAWMDAIWPTINDHYDVWSVHDYYSDATQTVAEHDRLQAKEGAEPIEIAVTEFGGCTWGCPAEAVVSEAVQSQTIISQLEALGALGYVSEAYQFEARDSPNPNASPWEKGFGLVRIDWTEKPAYGALADYLAL